MLHIEELKPWMSLVGLEPAAVESLVAVVPIAEATAQVIYKTPDGVLKRTGLRKISLVDFARPNHGNSSRRPIAFRKATA
jgi:hypothetical protein